MLGYFGRQKKTFEDPFKAFIEEPSPDVILETRPIGENSVLQNSSNEPDVVIENNEDV